VFELSGVADPHLIRGRSDPPLVLATRLRRDDRKGTPSPPPGLPFSWPLATPCLPAFPPEPEVVDLCSGPWAGRSHYSPVPVGWRCIFSFACLSVTYLRRPPPARRTSNRTWRDRPALHTFLYRGGSSLRDPPLSSRIQHRAAGVGGHSTGDPDAPDRVDRVIPHPHRAVMSLYHVCFVVNGLPFCR